MRGMIERHSGRFCNMMIYIPWHDWFSCFALLACGVICAIIFVWRHHTVNAGAPEFWLVTAGGMIYLAEDELFDWHGRIDKWIHRVLQIRETAYTDRIDDFIVLLYILGGILVLWLYWQEAVAVLRPAKSVLMTAIVLAILHCVFDAASNTHHPAQQPASVVGFRIHNMLSLGEQICELGAEVCLVIVFLIGIYSARRLEKRSGVT